MTDVSFTAQLKTNLLVLLYFLLLLKARTRPLGIYSMLGTTCKSDLRAWANNTCKGKRKRKQPLLICTFHQQRYAWMYKHECRDGRTNKQTDRPGEKERFVAGCKPFLSKARNSKHTVRKTGPNLTLLVHKTNQTSLLTAHRSWKNPEEEYLITIIGSSSASSLIQLCPI